MSTTPELNDGQTLDDRERLSASRAGAWRHEVLDRVGRLEHQLAQFTTDSGAATSVQENLDTARDIAHADKSRDGWSGRSIENAWRYLRLAEEGLVDLTQEDAAHHDDLAIAMNRALGHGTNNLPDDDPMLQDLRSLAAKADKTPEEWARVKELSSAVTIRSHEVSTQEHHQQRSFRNQLRGLTLVLLGLAVASVVVLLVLGPRAPADLLAAPAGLEPWIAVALAMAMGSFGALFSAVPSLSARPTGPSPFDTVKEQAALKVVVGAWSAVVGLVIVNAGMTSIGVDGETVDQVGSAAQAATMAGFAVMSAYFGATQEALTRFADRKATAVDPSTP